MSSGGPGVGKLSLSCLECRNAPRGRGIVVVRSLMIVNLIAALSFCPMFCGLEEADHGTHGHGAAGSASSDVPSAPGHCPEDGDNCICQGAIESAGVRVSDSCVLAPLWPLALQVPTAIALP